jgi:hypothetical protein
MTPALFVELSFEAFRHPRIRAIPGLSITWQPMIAGIRKKARNSGEILTGQRSYRHCA